MNKTSEPCYRIILYRYKLLTNLTWLGNAVNFTEQGNIKITAKIINNNADISMLI